MFMCLSQESSSQASDFSLIPTQSETMSSVSFGTNAAQNFFALRPEPKPLTVINTSHPLSRGRELRELHKAGGYDHANYERRNWSEIYDQLGVRV
jgi:hypothetical protein